MIRSMTGFGASASPQAGGGAGSSFRVEIRAVNNRFRELIVKLPRSLMALEEPIKQIVAAEVVRGRVEVFVQSEGQPVGQKLAVNRGLAEQYLAALTELKDGLGLSGEPDLRFVAGLPGVIGLGEDKPDLEAVLAELQPALEAALAGLVKMRRSEGQRLVQDIRERLEAVDEFRRQLEGLAQGLVAEAQERVRERLEALIGQEVEPQRLAQEAGILADKLDVTEELVRLASHLSQFRGYLDQGGAVGRRLDFLCQEMFREINTIGSKANRAEASQLVVETKAELEKIREQVQNLE